MLQREMVIDDQPALTLPPVLTSLARLFNCGLIACGAHRAKAIAYHMACLQQPPGVLLPVAALKFRLDFSGHNFHCYTKYIKNIR
jgi:hypothetical protein